MIRYHVTWRGNVHVYQWKLVYTSPEAAMSAFPEVRWERELPGLWVGIAHGFDYWINQTDMTEENELAWLEKNICADNKVLDIAKIMLSEAEERESTLIPQYRYAVRRIRDVIFGEFIRGVRQCS